MLWRCDSALRPRRYVRCVAIRSPPRCVAIPVRQLQEAQGVLAVFRGSSDLRTPRAEPGLTRSQPGCLLYVSDGASRALGHDKPMQTQLDWKQSRVFIADPSRVPRLPRARYRSSVVLERAQGRAGPAERCRWSSALRADLGTLAPPGSPKHTPRDPLATCVEQWRSGFPEEDDSSTPWASSTTAQQHTPKGWAASTPRSPKGD